MEVEGRHFIHDADELLRARRFNKVGGGAVSVRLRSGLDALLMTPTSACCSGTVSMEKSPRQDKIGNLGITEVERPPSKTKT